MKRIRVINGGGPGYTTKITDADTGQPIENVTGVQISFDVREMSTAVLHMANPIVDVIVDAEVHTHCPFCGQEKPTTEEVTT